MPAPTIGTITQNLTTLGQYQKLELTFPVTTQAVNLQLPYDSSVPTYSANMFPAEDGTKGVSIDGLFLPPSFGGVWGTNNVNALVWPGFYLDDFAYTPVPTGGVTFYNHSDCLTQQSAAVGCVRFAPNAVGTWGYKIRVTDAGGTVTSTTPGSLTVTSSTSKGFVRVSSTDSRYFAFDSGDALVTVGNNIFDNLSTDFTSHIAQIGATGAQVINRVWCSSRSGLEVVGAFSDSSGGRYWGYGGGGSQLTSPGYNSRYGFLLVSGGSLNTSELCLSAGVAYTASFWAKAASAQTITLVYQDAYTYANTLSTNFNIPGDSAWHQYTVSVAAHAPEGAGVDYRGALKFSSSGPNTVTLDRIQVLDPSSVDVMQGYGDFESHVVYNRRQSWTLDRVVEACEAQGQLLRLNLFEHNDDNFCEVNADGTPYLVNAGGSREDKFHGESTDPTSDLPVRRWKKYALRYYLARWGYSTAVAQFEYCNEAAYSNGNHHAAVQAMGAIVHGYTTHGRRLVSTSIPTNGGGVSYDVALFEDKTTYPDVDYGDVHLYPGTPYYANPYDPLSDTLTADSGGRRGLGCWSTTQPQHSFIGGGTGATYLQGQGTWQFEVWIQADDGLTMNWFGRGPYVEFDVDGGSTKYYIPDGTASPPLTGAGFPWTKFTGSFTLPDANRHLCDISLYTETLAQTVSGGTAKVRWQDIKLTAPDGRLWLNITCDEPTMHRDTLPHAQYTTQRYMPLSGDVCLGQPITVGETDLDDLANNYDTSITTDTAGVYLRHFAFGHTGPTGSILFLYTNGGGTATVNGHWRHVKTLQTFMRGIPLASGNYRNAEVAYSTPQLIGVGQKDLVNNKAHIFVRNRAANWYTVASSPGTITPVSGSVTVPGLANGTYTLETWNTAAATFTTSSLVASGGTGVSIPVTSLTSDTAYKLYPSSTMPYTPPTIPVPPAPSTPTGTTAGETTYFDLPAAYSTGSTLAGSDLERLVTLVDNGMAAGLAAIGYGSLVGGAAGTPSGLTIPVTAWRGILPATTSRLGYAGAVVQAATLTIPASSSFVVWAVPVSGTYADATPYDTAESGIAAFEVVTDGSNVNGGLPLFSGTTGSTAVTGSITDLRQFIGTTQLQAALTALQGLEASDVAALYAKLGTGYLPGASPAAAPVDSRLTALEAGAVQSLSILWGLLPRSATDSSTIEQYVTGLIGPPVVPPAPIQLDDDVIVSNVIKNLAAITTIANAATYANNALDILLVIPGITSDSLIDFIATTAVVDEIGHVFS